MNRKHVALIDRLEQNGKDLWYLAQLSEGELHAVPAPNEWTIHQIAAHMRDTEQQVFLLRARRMLAEAHPTVQNFEQDEWWQSHPYLPSEPLKQIVAEFRVARRKLIPAAPNVRPGLGELGDALRVRQDFARLARVAQLQPYARAHRADGGGAGEADVGRTES